MTTQELKQRLHALRIEKENRELHLQLARYKRAFVEQEHIIAGLYISLEPNIESFDIRDLSDYGRGYDTGEILDGKHDLEILLKEEQEVLGIVERRFDGDEFHDDEGIDLAIDDIENEAEAIIQSSIAEAQPGLR